MDNIQNTNGIPRPIKPTWTPLNKCWKPIGVYRTFPLPILPLLPVVPRIKWSRPDSLKGLTSS